jgi:outer membrane receptor protein involved in Fe transport
MAFFGDYASVGDGFFVPILDINNVFQYNGAMTYNRGAHNIKFGGALIRRQLNYFQDPFSAQGGFVFLPVPYVDPKTGDVTFNSMVNLLTGNPAFAERGNSLTHSGDRTWEPSAYVQDDWRAKKWLTLNLGVRYEIFTPFTEAHKQQSNFNSKTLSVEQASSSNPTMGVNTEYHDFSPRIGFAATLKHDLVVRGGFGISYYPTDVSTGAIQNSNPRFSFACFPCFGSSFPILPLPVTSTTNPAGAVTQAVEFWTGLH